MMELWTRSPLALLVILSRFLEITPALADIEYIFAL